MFYLHEFELVRHIIYFSHFTVLYYLQFLHSMQ